MNLFFILAITLAGASFAHGSELMTDVTCIKSNITTGEFEGFIIARYEGSHAALLHTERRGLQTMSEILIKDLSCVQHMKDPVIVNCLRLNPKNSVFRADGNVTIVKQIMISAGSIDSNQQKPQGVSFENYQFVFRTNEKFIKWRPLKGQCRPANETEITLVKASARQ